MKLPTRLYTIGVIIALMLIVSVLTRYAMFAPSALQGTILQPTPILATCSSDNNEFFNLQFEDVTQDNDVIDQWSVQFTELINTLTQQQLDDSNLEVECTAQTIGDFVKPTPAMQNILAEWEPFISDPDTAKLSRLDIGYVLLELLRHYECALQERYHFTEVQVTKEMVYEQFKDTYIPGVLDVFNLSERPVMNEAGEQKQKIIKELAITRKAVEQTVRLLSGKERTALVRAEVECLERASLDIRNATGLAAEANSCLPRIWNSKDTLIDLQP